MTDLRYAQDVLVGDLVRFSPGSDSEPDLCLRVHLRKDVQFPEAAELTYITITHEDGCWSKRLDEFVEIVGRKLIWERNES